MNETAAMYGSGSLRKSFMKEKYSAEIIQASEFVTQKLTKIPRRAVVLGSGLGILVNGMENAVQIKSDEIPGFPKSTVDGHDGLLVAGELDGVEILALRGRVHGYEGYSQQQVVFPLHLFAALGIEKVLLTNAVGSINRLMHPGDLVLLDDQINLMFRNPLQGINDDKLGPRFPDMSAPYSLRMQRIAKDVALKSGIALASGVMGGVTGPSYETPAEIRMLRTLGADVVGMSTIPEIITAKHIGLEAAAISCVTNYAAGLGEAQLNHAEVTEVAERTRPVFRKLLVELMAAV
jgi:purine-nucleoside phosphorylase